MILRYSLLSSGLIAFGTVIGVILVNGPRGAWYWLLDSTEPARHGLAVFFMAATGGHADPRETGPLNVLPDAVPEGLTPLLTGTVDDVRREHDQLTAAEIAALRPSARMSTGEFEALDERVGPYLPPSVHGRHARTSPRLPLTEQVIDVTRAPGHAPWSGSFTALQDPDADARSDDETADEIRRAAFARSLIEQHDPADITPQVLEDVLASLRAMPVQEARQRFACCVCCLGSTVPCEPPDMHLASCADCDAPVYGETPVADVLEAERLERLMRP